MVRGGGERRRGEHEWEQRAHRAQPPFCLRLLLVCGRSNLRATAGINLYAGYDERALGERALRDDEHDADTASARAALTLMVHVDVGDHQRRGCFAAARARARHLQAASFRHAVAR